MEATRPAAWAGAALSPEGSAVLADCGCAEVWLLPEEDVGELLSPLRRFPVPMRRA